MRRVQHLRPHSLHRRPVGLHREVVQARIEYTHDGGDRWGGTSYVLVLRADSKYLPPIERDPSSKGEEPERRYDSLRRDDAPRSRAGV